MSVERSVAWGPGSAAWRDSEQLQTTLEIFHYVALYVALRVALPLVWVLCMCITGASGGR